MRRTVFSFDRARGWTLFNAALKRTDRDFLRWLWYYTVRARDHFYRFLRVMPLRPILDDFFMLNKQSRYMVLRRVGGWLQNNDRKRCSSNVFSSTLYLQCNRFTAADTADAKTLWLLFLHYVFYSLCWLSIHVYTSVPGVNVRIVSLPPLLRTTLSLDAELRAS